MTDNSWIYLCFAYIVGLSATNLVIWGSEGLTKQQLILVVLGLIGLAVILSLATSKLRLGKITYRLWIGATIIGILGVIYFDWRIPQPRINDISYQVTSSEDKLVTVVGKVLNEPRLNENQRLKFSLATAAIKPSEEVSGKLYVTIPLLQGTGIYPGQNLEVKGILYKPQAASNPGGFNFKSYLARQGIFAGLKGIEVTITSDSQASWGWWRLRQRIVRSQLRGLGSPVGQLVSSMVLGQKAVDLPKDIRDRFIEVGLAHVLAASGFQVSLLIGLVLKLTTNLSKQVRLVTGVGTLIIYLSLTGIQASIFRAFLMGIAVLIALVMDTKVKPLGSLLLAATIILLLNPLLIGDLGFQLSFLATLGLIVTLPALQAKLDWLPPTIATLIAVPVAASIWVLPLLGYVFNAVANYSLLVNILVTPLITIISLGGMLSAIAALVMPILGSAIAFMLLYPTLLLLAVTNFFTSLPASSWAIGQISLGVLLIIYGLIILLHLNLWWRKHWGIALVFILTLLVIPIGYNHWRLTQITILATNPQPVIVIQDQGQVFLINSGEGESIRYNVLPFLRQQGINYLDYGINLSSDFNFESNWLTISEHLPINYFVSLGHQSHLLLNNSRIKSKSFNEPINTKSFNLSFNSKLSVLQLETTEATWLILNDVKRDELEITQYIQQSNWNKKPLILLGSKISATWLQLLPKTIITSKPLPAYLKRNLDTVTSYNLQQHGAIAWTPQYSFQTSIIESTSNNNY
ncbi:ComEC/Rec2-related protein [Chondrocystis sp. NIES-4102]|nr:ComEC/Rec2-related protein [Chondrocystis sp. NIES-4102]